MNGLNRRSSSSQRHGSAGNMVWQLNVDKVAPVA